MEKVKAKKHLGQHFLNDQQIAKDIVEGLTLHRNYNEVLEIGPGMGVLTQFLLQNKDYHTRVVDIDGESIQYLKKAFPFTDADLIHADFLKANLNEWYSDTFAIIGNFPYNISTEILFKVLDYREQIPEVVGMFQKEVAERFAAKHGNKTYGITSVLIQAYYDVEYLFTVPEHVFTPPPKVKSGVIRLKRNNRNTLPCSESDFFKVVKAGFGMRRKTLRNALKAINVHNISMDLPIFDKRAEQLSVEDFFMLTNIITGK
ncbi:MAG TPA: 16S rRNA (adenine(1518)-N(6)/adenine(1519)-N(6))-dimethyltransferase RsmA [Cytophaga sp.]|jgi:16S rRNA (adenine1518-N6/adenine1519-N6)-dimethyltransferase|nr:16S rRNA (adenine(1518)-N(6)/adenine(1519)-N(6))-dimethyltransferase RsmA [Cytophaga sp.]